MDEQRIRHNIPPVYDSHSRILILGSFPSVKSRESAFFYGHPQNRFWKVLAGCYQTAVPAAIPEKKEFLLGHGIAMWDVIAACEITGSADASITQAIPNDLSEILETAEIRAIFVNGRTAEKYYQKYQRLKTGIPAVCLPSTSPANAAWSLERLTSVWSEALRRGMEGCAPAIQKTV